MPASKFIEQEIQPGPLTQARHRVESGLMTAHKDVVKEIKKLGDENLLHRWRSTRDLNRMDWNPVLRRINERCDRFVTLLQIPDYKERHQKLRRLIEQDDANVKADVAALAQKYRPVDAIGHKLGIILIGLGFPPLVGMQAKADRCEQINRNLVVAFALNRRLSEGVTPENNAALLLVKALAKGPNEHLMCLL